MKNKINHVLAVQDGQDGDSESCSTSTLKYYSKDGEVLTIYFDYNT